MKEMTFKGRIQKKLLSFWLTVAMVITLLPGMGVTVYADTAPDYLTFTAEENNSSVTFKYSEGYDVQYKINNEDWEDYEYSCGDDGYTITLNKGDKVSFKGNSVVTSETYCFAMTGKIAASGDVTSLTNEEGGDCSLEDYSECYQGMFEGCTSLTTAPDLPSTTLAEGCYQSMFEGCTSLTTAPDLPSTTLAEECYYGMFKGCTSLTTAPDLQSITLAEECYYGMFEGCTSLTTAPALPATELKNYCYRNMFKGCSSLTTAPALSATTLKNSCYESMFEGCTSLITAPTLAATALASQCYYCMFRNCTNLTTAPTLPATTLSYSCYREMFSGCTNLTTAPTLSATTLESNCYDHMFKGCTSLTKMPALPATTLASSCYASMFDGCTSLTSVSSLSATILASQCYAWMFQNCSNLTLLPELPATNLQEYCYYYMFNGCSGIKLYDSEAAAGGNGAKSWSIPSGATEASDWNTSMFGSTGGNFTGNPVIGTTYYLAKSSSTPTEDTTWHNTNHPQLTSANEIMNSKAGTKQSPKVLTIQEADGDTGLVDVSYVKGVAKKFTIKPDTASSNSIVTVNAGTKYYLDGKYSVVSVNAAGTSYSQAKDMKKYAALKYSSKLSSSLVSLKKGKKLGDQYTVILKKADGSDTVTLIVNNLSFAKEDAKRTYDSKKSISVNVALKYISGKEQSADHRTSAITWKVGKNTVPMQGSEPLKVGRSGKEFATVYIDDETGEAVVTTLGNGNKGTVSLKATVNGKKYSTKVKIK